MDPAPPCPPLLLNAKPKSVSDWSLPPLAVHVTVPKLAPRQLGELVKSKSNVKVGTTEVLVKSKCPSCVPNLPADPNCPLPTTNSMLASVGQLRPQKLRVLTNTPPDVVQPLAAGYMRAALVPLNTMG